MPRRPAWFDFSNDDETSEMRVATCVCETSESEVTYSPGTCPADSKIPVRWCHRARQAVRSHRTGQLTGVALVLGRVREGTSQRRRARPRRGLHSFSAWATWSDHPGAPAPTLTRSAGAEIARRRQRLQRRLRMAPYLLSAQQSEVGLERLTQVSFLDCEPCDSRRRCAGRWCATRRERIFVVEFSRPTGERVLGVEADCSPPQLRVVRIATCTFYGACPSRNALQSISHDPSLTGAREIRVGPPP